MNMGPKSLLVLTFCVIGLLLPAGAVIGQIHYKLSRPELPDNMLRQARSWNHAPPDVLVRDDNVARWIRSARDRTIPTRRRVAAVKRLHKYRQHRVKRCFVSLMGDRSMAVREQVIVGLGKLAFPSTVRILIDALRYCRGRPRQAARASLRIITGNDFGNDLGAWRLWYRQHRRDYR